MSTLLALAAIVVSLYTYVLLARVVLDLIQVFSRDWRPTGVILVLVEAVYTVTDPPIKLVRRFLPPLRLGSIALDFGIIVIFIAVQIVSRVLFQLSGVVA